jgi:hypothetical protein
MELEFMKILNVKITILVFIAQMAFASNSIAGLIGPGGWNGDNINGFLGNGAFPGIETSVSTLDFSGEWMYTAIGRESGNTNDIDKATSAGLGALDTSLTFSTASATNWGVWDTVNFDTDNLFFEDSDGPWNVGIDTFGAINDPGFKLFRLTQATTLTYLTGNPSLTLLAGDIIVGFNDNHLSSSDADYDDIIIAMRATSVPTPGSLALMGLGLFGLMFMKRRSV